MRDSRKNLLQLIYDCDQREGRPLQINSDGKDISSDTLTLRNDVRYLKDNGYIRETNPILHSYVLTLTEKGEYFVENGFRLPEAHPTTSFDFGNATITNAVIGNNTSGNEFTFSKNSPLSELESLIQSKPASDQDVLNEMLEILREIHTSEKPVEKGRLSRFYEFIKKSSDLVLPISEFLFDVFFRSGS